MEQAHFEQILESNDVFPITTHYRRCAYTAHTPQYQDAPTRANRAPQARHASRSIPAALFSDDRCSRNAKQTRDFDNERRLYSIVREHGY